MRAVVAIRLVQAWDMKGAMSMPTLPPLLFKGEDAYDVWHPVRIAYDIASGGQRVTWPTQWYTCCAGMDDIGIDCCCAHGFCSPCIYASALETLGISEARTAAYSGIVAGLVPRDQHGSGNAIATVAALGSGFKGGEARTKLHALLYGQTGYEAGAWTNTCLHTCCRPCVYCQETNAVIVYAREHHGTPVAYGPATSCTCCYLVEAINPARKILALPFKPSFPSAQAMARR